MRSLKVKEVAALLGTESEVETQVIHYEIDSRRVEAGSCFFALSGQKTDGHDYLMEAAENGAIMAVVSGGYQGSNFGLELVYVDDVKLSLQNLAKELLETRPKPVLAITGSLGKTTTKDFAEQILKAKYQVYASPKSFNSQLTVPLTLLNRTGDEDLILLEMGMSEKGEMKRLIEIAPPDMALITTIDMVHIGAFEEGLLGIAKEKAVIFSSPKTKVKIAEYDTLKFGLYSDVLTFSMENEKADVTGKILSGIDCGFKEVHLQKNLLAAVALCLEWMDLEEIKAAAKNLQTPKMRYEKVNRGGILFINDAYNAIPTSVRAALESMPSHGGKKIAVLGQMVDLGTLSEEMHKKVGEYAAQFVDELYCTGANCTHMLDAFMKSGKKGYIFPDLKSLAVKLNASLNQGDVVLVKASRKYEFERIFSYLES